MGHEARQRKGSVQIHTELEAPAALHSDGQHDGSTPPLGTDSGAHTADLGPVEGPGLSRGGSGFGIDERMVTIK